MRAGTRVSGAWLALALTAGAQSPDPRGPLPEEARTNGAQTLSAVDSLKGAAVRTTAGIVDEKGKLVCAATWVGSDGYFIAPSSALMKASAKLLRLPEGRTFPYDIIQRNPACDIALGRATGAGRTTPVNWAASRALGIGQWLCTTRGGGQEMRIGVVSANRRQIPGFGAALGVRMEQQAATPSRGVRVVGIAADSPAEAAGLVENDVLLSLGGTAVNQFEEVHRIVSHRQPGEEIEVRYLRKGKEATCTVRLASRTKVISNWEGEDFANGGISIRTDNYPDVIQHDIPLLPEDMGSPLFDLNGRGVGINISRVDRVTTFALPMEVFWATVQQWIADDRSRAAPKPAAAVEEVKKAVRVSPEELKKAAQ